MAAVLPVERPLRERPYARQQAMLALFVLLFGAVVSWVAEPYLNGYRQQLVILCAIYAIVAVALALTSGFTGVFSLGQIGFLAIGAYVSALLTMPPMVEAANAPAGAPLTGWPPSTPATWHPQVALLFASIIAGVVAAAVGALVGAPLMRLSGNYVAVATMGFLIIVYSVLVNWDTGDPRRARTQPDSDLDQHLGRVHLGGDRRLHRAPAAQLPIWPGDDRLARESDRVARHRRQCVAHPPAGVCRQRVSDRRRGVAAGAPDRDRGAEHLLLLDDLQSSSSWSSWAAWAVSPARWWGRSS